MKPTSSRLRKAMIETHRTAPPPAVFALPAAQKAPPVIVHPVITTSDHASEVVTRRIVENLSERNFNGIETIVDHVLDPVRRVLRSGQKLKPLAVKAYITRASEIFGSHCDPIFVTDVFDHDPIKKTAVGRSLCHSLRSNDGRVQLQTTSIRMTRLSYEISVATPHLYILPHAITRFFRRAGRDYDAFRAEISDAIADACLMAPILGPNRHFAIATPTMLLCGRTAKAHRPGYALFYGRTMNRGRINTEIPPWTSPFLRNGEATEAMIATALTVESLGEARSALHGTLLALQEQIRDTAIAHLTHVTLGVPFVPSDLRRDLVAIQSFYAGEMWQAYEASVGGGSIA